MKTIVAALLGTALITAPMAANAQRGYGAGSHAGGGFRGGGNVSHDIGATRSGSTAYRGDGDQGYRGGDHGYRGDGDRGYRGGYGWRGGYGYGWGGLGLGLGFGLGAALAYDSFYPGYYGGWGYPAYYGAGGYAGYGYDGYADRYSDPWAAESAAPQACGAWVWHADQNRYVWNTSAC